MSCKRFLKDPRWNPDTNWLHGTTWRSRPLPLHAPPDGHRPRPPTGLANTQCRPRNLRISMAISIATDFLILLHPPKPLDGAGLSGAIYRGALRSSSRATKTAKKWGIQSPTPACHIRGLAGMPGLDQAVLGRLSGSQKKYSFPPALGYSRASAA